MKRFITSVGALRNMLALVNHRTWKSTPDDWRTWLRRGLIGSGSTRKVLREKASADGVKRFEVEEDSTAHVKDKVTHNAQYAFACFVSMSDFSLQHQVPLVVDQ